MRPLVRGNDPDVDAQLVSPVTQRRHEVSGFTGCFRVEIREWLTLGLGYVEHRSRFEPDEAFDHSSGGVSSYSQSLLS